MNGVHMRTLERALRVVKKGKQSEFMHRLPVSPLIGKGLEIAERELGMTELSVRLGSPEGTINAWRGWMED